MCNTPLKECYIAIWNMLLKLHINDETSYCLIQNVQYCFFHKNISSPSLLNWSGIGLHVSLHQIYIYNIYYTEQLQYGCFESFPFRQNIVIFVRQITWFRWTNRHWTSGVNVQNKSSNRFVPFQRSILSLNFC
jgi:hypothetical protein